MEEEEAVESYAFRRLMPRLPSEAASEGEAAAAEEEAAAFLLLPEPATDFLSSPELPEEAADFNAISMSRTKSLSLTEQ